MLKRPKADTIYSFSGGGEALLLTQRGVDLLSTSGRRTANTMLTLGWYTLKGGDELICDRINLEKNMKITKRNPILGLVNDFVIDSPAPTNLTYFWNFGS